MNHSKKYRLIGERLIRTLPEFGEIVANGTKIAYLESQEEKKNNGKIKFADCTLVNKKYKWCCKYDFFITVYAPNVVDFTEKQLEILIEHELLHVGVDYPDSGLKYHIVEHDIEEFWQIVNKYGLDWSDTNAERTESE